MILLQAYGGQGVEWGSLNTTGVYQGSRLKLESPVFSDIWTTAEFGLARCRVSSRKHCFVILTQNCTSHYDLRLSQLGYQHFESRISN